MAVEIAASFLERQLASWTLEKPLVLGISGPQGSGKSYLADNLLNYLGEKHPELHCVGVLIDDFYLTHDEQAIVSERARKSGNFVLEGRGLPGTHDLSLAESVLTGLVSRKTLVSIPRYDKSAYDGEGDRELSTKWQHVETPVDVVIFEGWFNGYRAIEPLTFGSIYMAQDPSGPVHRSSMHHLAEINEKLAEYEKLWAFIDILVVLKTHDLDYIYQWRLQQETALVARSGNGMSASAVALFVNRYMPMYHLYYWRLCDRGILRKGTNLCLEVDLTRAITALTEY